MLELHFAKLVPNVDFLGPRRVLARVLPRVRRFVAWFRWDFSPSKHHQVHKLLKEIALKSSSSLTWKIRIGGITADLHSWNMEWVHGMGPWNVDLPGRWTVSQYIWSATVLFATEVLITLPPKVILCFPNWNCASKRKNTFFPSEIEIWKNLYFLVTRHFPFPLRCLFENLQT